MINFNDSSNRSILVGYIKELLCSVNLPSIKVFDSKTACEEYFNFDIEVYVIIRNYKRNEEDKTEQPRDSVILFVRNTNEYNETEVQFVFIEYYTTNEQLVNLSSTFYLYNGVYDTYTHTYLGKFLRFVRDYYDINLMSMYNCFANEVHQRDNGNYKYLMIPVEYGKTYTFALNSSKAFSYLISTDDIEQIMAKDEEYTWTTIKAMTYKNPILLEVPSATSSEEFFKEHLLNIIIKLPLTNESSVVCLESDYTAFPTHFVPIQLNYEKNINNQYAFANKYFNWAKEGTFLSNLQLLKVSRSDGSSYAFSDRLTEYLVGNVISPRDKINQNIVDAKFKLYTKYQGFKATELPVLDPRFSTMLRFQFLETPLKNTLFEINDEDLLGYVDKDIESLLNDERYPQESEGE